MEISPFSPDTPTRIVQHSFFPAEGVPESDDLLPSELEQHSYFTAEGVSESEDYIPSEQYNIHTSAGSANINSSNTTSTTTATTNNNNNSSTATTNNNNTTPPPHTTTTTINNSTDPTSLSHTMGTIQAQLHTILHRQELYELNFLQKFATLEYRIEALEAAMRLNNENIPLWQITKPK